MLPYYSVILACIVLVQAAIVKRDHSRQYYTLHFPQGHLDDATHHYARDIAHSLGTRYEGQVGELKTYFVVSSTTTQSPLEKRSTTSSSTSLSPGDDSDDPVVASFHQQKHQALVKRWDESHTFLWSKVQRIDKQKLRKRSKRAVIPPAPVLNTGKLVLEDAQASLGIMDPGFTKQWHLVNQEHTGNDINVTSVWKQGVTGNGTIVAILDDGVDYKSRDLKDNFYAEGSYDFNDHVDLPTPVLWNDYHGTRCAGQIAASKNDACGVGIAYNSKVSGIRILSGEITDVDEAAALNYKFQENDIFSCSWGPTDDGKTMEAPNGILADAFVNGIENGRGGKGTVYVFATGNGGDAGDNCNFDGYTNSIYTITVGALDHTNKHPSYAERCSAQLVVTYSSGGGKSIYTTNHGSAECTDIHGGTSAAAPNAAGIFALVLSVRPDLTWRDMQHLCVQTALPVDLKDDDWKKLPSGHMYNHKYGYGKLDTWAIIEAAKVFKNVNKQTHLELPISMTKTKIPDTTADKHKKPLQSIVQVTQDMITAAGLLRLEHITATVNIEHQRRGDIQIVLQSPNKVESELAAVRVGDASSDGIHNWKFMTVKHWEENPVGNWTLLVYDEINADSTGHMLNWTMTLFGEMDPEFEGEPVHRPGVNHDTSNEGTTSGDKSAPSATPTQNKDSHAPPRPTRVKPATTSSSDSDSASPAATTATVTSHMNDDESVSPGGSTMAGDGDEKDSGHSGFIYAFIGTAVLLGLATTMYLYKRNQRRSPSLPRQSSAIPAMDYEFDELKPEDEDEDEDEDYVQGTADDRPLLSQDQGRQVR
ncbi:peptidase S8/S53 domain-containing protein [Absidia repens]|uniref:Peptidase S8/S53 domain-containing protein n=1 Tax=Absidia repens TaxID=90262 RepID=A0A1X2IXI9_9FUNG|nr:peptidase S8/S53 domain-containing protein [Absidia repens]